MANGLEEIMESSLIAPDDLTPHKISLDYLKKNNKVAYDSITKALDEYAAKVEASRKDTLRFVPWKDIFKLRKEEMGGLLGYTYLGSRMAVVQEQADLQDRYVEVLVHELIHTDNEYETRIIARWMLNEKELIEYMERNRDQNYGKQGQNQY